MHHTDEVIDFTECDLGDAEMEYQRAREDLGEVKVRKLLGMQKLRKRSYNTPAADLLILKTRKGESSPKI